MSHPRQTTLLSALIVPAALAIPLVLSAQAAKSYSLSGNRVAIYNLAGKATVEAGSGSATMVEVSPVGADGAKLTVATGAKGSRQALRVIYPDDDIIYPVLGRGSRTDVRVDDEGYFDDNDHDRYGHRITIRGSGSGLEAHADLKVKVAPGSSVDLHLAAGDVTVTEVNGSLMVSTGSGNVSAAGVKGDLDIDTGSGDVKAERVTGALRIDTGSGNVDARQQSGGRIDIDTGSGDVTLSGAAADDLKVDTGSGEIRIDGASSPRLTLETGSGNVTAAVSGKVDRISVETGSGDVRLNLPSDFSGRLDIESSSDDGIDVDFPIQLVRKDDGELHARIGDGTGEIHVETGSGRVKLGRS
ncbi:MAG TPA: DUF4097 family beta strand repeat-containing protein [Gemmatimonadales bacterium]|nr:DUF4097 family beta strand repeat-containing protein [Gemmatimonadales bacterium]